MELNDANKAYIDGQSTWIVKNTVEVGTKVRVIRTAQDYELGWNNCWIDEMDGAVDDVFTVVSRIDQDTLDEYDKLEAGGINLNTIGGISLYYDLMFPYYVLEVVK